LLDKNTRLLEHFVHTPLLGICYGMQVLAQAHGGAVRPLKAFRRGPRTVRCAQTGPFCAFFSHANGVASVPPGFDALARRGAWIDVMRRRDGMHVGVQFHPEMTGGQLWWVLWKFMSI
jgi:GMP synthase (glutamine-hydrolysing)